MKPYLSLLRQYRVKTSLDLPVFLEKANLTETEREYLHEHIGSIELLYKVPFENAEEMLIYQADLIKWDNKYTEWKVADYIASSMPYDSIIALRNGKAIKYFTFARHENSRNMRRSVIDERVPSPPVVIGRCSDMDKRVEKCLEQALTTKKNPKEVFLFLKVRFTSMYHEKGVAYRKRLRMIDYAQYDEISKWESVVPPEELQTFYKLYFSRRREEDDYAWE